VSHLLELIPSYVVFAVIDVIYVLAGGNEAGNRWLRGKRDARHRRQAGDGSSGHVHYPSELGAIPLH